MYQHSGGGFVAVPRAFWLLIVAVLVAGCGAGAGNSALEPSATPPAVGWNGEVDDAPYVAYERVSFERLPKERLEPAGEVRLPQQVRRISAFRLRDDDETTAIRFTDDSGKGWLAWQPAIVLNVRRELARQAGTQPSQIITLGVWRVLWPDGCLGVPAAATACSAEPMPGFRVRVRTHDTTVTYHTDLRDRIVRAPG
ncbi:MAG: hypothetical protein AB7R89_29190 [Dehalococcoidia bacterium]